MRSLLEVGASQRRLPRLRELHAKRRQEHSGEVAKAAGSGVQTVANDARFASKASSTSQTQNGGSLGYCRNCVYVCRAATGPGPPAAAAALPAAVQGRTHLLRPTLVQVVERLKQGYQYMLPSICVEIFSKTNSDQKEYTTVRGGAPCCSRGPASTADPSLRCPALLPGSATKSSRRSPCGATTCATG